MDCLTVLAVSLLFMVELLILLLLFLRRELQRLSPASDRRFRQNHGVIRPVAFLYLFAMDLPVSFLPIFMAELYDRNPLAGLHFQIDIVQCHNGSEALAKTAGFNRKPAHSGSPV